MTVNIHEFGKLFADSYGWLYEQDHSGEATREYMQQFDEVAEASEGFKQFVREFVAWRGDFISSDREAAAFMLTLERMAERGLIA